VAENCTTTDPALEQTAPGRAVACLYADGTNAKADAQRAAAVDSSGAAPRRIAAGERE